MFYGITRLYDLHFQREKKPVAFRQEDIVLLANMCMTCEPVVFVGKFIKKHFYSYYIPANENDIAFIKEVFARNGIETQIHTTKLLNPWGNESLRVKLDNTSKENKTVMFMRSIKAKQRELWSTQEKSR